LPHTVCINHEGVLHAVKIEKELTIDQVAELMNCSKDTIRRKIKKGEITAIKRTDGPYGDQYFINENDLNIAMEIHEVIPVERNLSVQDFAKVLDSILAKHMAPMQQELATLSNGNRALIDELQALKQDQQKIEKENKARDTEALQANEASRKEIAALHDSLNAVETHQKDREATHFDLVDKRLNELSEASKKGFWARLFGR
jgi:excisionase family DNA binding protein